MPLKLHQRPGGSGVWHVSGTVQGQRVRQSTGCNRRSDAEAVKAKLEADLFRQAVYGAPSVRTFSDAIAGHVRAGGAPEHLEALNILIGHKLLKDIDQSLVDSLTSDTVKPATNVRRIHAPISAVMTFAHEQGWVGPLKIRKPKIDNGRTDYLTPEEADDWAATVPAHLAPLFVFYLATGCRASEALNLQWRDVDPDGRVVFWQTKAGYPRGVDLPPRALRAMPPRGKPDAFVFLNSRGQPWHGYDAVNLMLRRHRERQPQLAPVHCHLLRHTWATWAYAVTRDLTYVMSRGGWKSLSLLGRYAHAASPGLAARVTVAGWDFSDGGLLRDVERPAKTPPLSGREWHKSDTRKFEVL